MQNIIPLFFGALFVYLLFFRKGGMGCCGSHSSHEKEHDKSRHLNEISANRKEEVIDLGKDQYTVLTVEEDRPPN
jgi:hypothetical protein